MGPIFVKGFRQRNASFLLHRFLCSISQPVSSSRRALCSRRGAQEPSRLAVAPTFPHAPALARPYLDGSEHDGTLDAIGTTIRGELAIGRESSRRNLVFGRSIET